MHFLLLYRVHRHQRIDRRITAAVCPEETFELRNGSDAGTGDVRPVLDFDMVDIDEDDIGLRSGAQADESRIGKQAVSIGQAQQGTAPQNPGSAAQACQYPVIKDQVLVLMAPWIGPAVIGISKASHTGFIAVVDRRRPRPGHLQQDCLPHDLHIDALECRCRSQPVRPPHNAVGPCQEAGVVMIGQFIHSDPERIIGHGIPVHAGDRPPEGIRIAIAFLIAGVAVLFHAREEKCDRLHEELIVHDGVPLIPLQPHLGVRVILGDNDCLRVRLFDRLAKPLPETVVKFRRIPQVGSHIQAPSVGVIGRRYPLAADLQDIFAQFLRVLIIQLGEGLKVPP